MKQIIFTAILCLIFSFSAFAQTQNSPCPVIEVTGGGVVDSGQPMDFTAIVTGRTVREVLEYEWKVSQGEISSGQGTPSITVETTGLAGKTEITAEVKIKGLDLFCTKTASKAGSVMPPVPIIDPDEFGKLPYYEIKIRIENFYRELENNPDAQGYLINYGTDKEIADREWQVQKATRALKLDANRVTLVRGGPNPNGDGVWTKVWIVQPGEEYPKP
jgi:hypothetical protein